MTTPPEELPAPTSTTAPKPPKPPRRKRGGDTANLDTATKSDSGTGSPPAIDATVASTTGAPAPPKRGRRNAGAESGAGTAAPAGAAETPTAARAKPAKAASAKMNPAPVTARTAPKTPDLPPATPVPTIATSDADADAVLVDETPPPPRRTARSTGVTSVSAGAPTVVGTGRTSAVRTERRFRQTVSKVDLWSVTKLSLCFYLSSMFVTIVAIVALWVIASAAGIINSIEKFLGDLLSAKNFHFLSATVLRGAILVGLVVVALQVVLTVISASFYNIFAELFGGVEITVKEEGPSE